MQAVEAEVEDHPVLLTQRELLCIRAHLHLKLQNTVLNLDWLWLKPHLCITTAIIDGMPKMEVQQVIHLSLQLVLESILKLL